jgi:monoamine oxidase
MRMGDVARMVFHFRARQWRRIVSGMRAAGRDGFGFLHAPGESVPVWWALSGQPVVVGWAGGPAATHLLAAPERRRREIALGSLGNVLGVAAPELRQSLLHWEHWNWTADPFARGAYSFAVAGGDDDPAELARPLKGTLFFAGEATAQGAEVGTVHGALASGIRAAGEVSATARRAKSRRI